MDIETLVRALSESERDELLERLTTASETSETDDSQNTSGCCGGSDSKSQGEKMANKGEMCCGGQ